MIVHDPSPVVIANSEAIALSLVITVYVKLTLLIQIVVSSQSFG